MAITFTSWTGGGAGDPVASGFQSTPQGADAGNVIDDRFQELKENISKRLEAGGHLFTQDPNGVGHGLGALPDANDGRHVVDAGGSDKSPHWYKSDGTTKLVDVQDTGATMDSGSAWYGPNISTGANPGHQHDTTMVFYLPTISTGFVEGVLFWNQGNGTATIQSARALAWDSPSSTVNIDIEKLDNGWTDPMDGADSVVTTNSLRILSGSNLDDGTVTLHATHKILAVGDMIRFRVTSGSGFDDLQVVLVIRRG